MRNSDGDKGNKVKELQYHRNGFNGIKYIQTFVSEKKRKTEKKRKKVSTIARCFLSWLHYRGHSKTSSGSRKKQNYL